MSNYTFHPEIIEHFEHHQLHPDIKLLADGTLDVRDHSRRSDECESRTLKIYECYLPTNTVYSEITRLSDCPAMCIPAIEAISYAASLTSSSKSKCHTLCSHFRAITKYLEHLWLKDIFNLTQVTKHDCDELTEILASGGWNDAVDIENRILDILTSDGIPTFTQKRKIIPNRKKLCRLIGTNLSHLELSKRFESVDLNSINNASDQERETFLHAPDRPLKYSNLRNTMDAINFLHYVSERYQIQFLPFPGSSAVAARVTETAGRTADIDGAKAGLLLENSLTMVYQIAPDLLKILEHAALLLKTEDCTGRSKNPFFDALDFYASKLEISTPTALYYKVDKLKRNLNSLNVMVRDILSACFINIAIFNARRKDEIVHKRFGLYRHCCNLVNKDLHIHEAEFYIEKRVKDYVSFFVGDATVQSIKILEQLQLILDLAPTNKTSSKEDTLFRYRIFEWSGLANGISTFNFGIYKTGRSRQFIKKFMGDGNEFRVTPHMFRRLYCTIFMNQHEYPHLQALSQQLQHGELAVTQIYISSPNTQNAATALSKLYDWKIDQYSEPHADHNREIMKLMTEAKSEKFAEIIYTILTHEYTSGGYSKFARKAFKSLQKSLQMQDFDKIDLIDSLVQQLHSRGYSPEPFRHSQCMVGTSKLKIRSKCWDESSQMLRKDKSSPDVCSRCPFSFTSQAHIVNMKTDADALLSKIIAGPDHTLSAKLLSFQHENLSKVISYHDSNMGKPYA